MSVIVRIGALLAAGTIASVVIATATTGTATASRITGQSPMPLAVVADQNGVLRGSSFNLTGTGYDSCPDFGHRTVNVLWDGASMGVTVPIQSDGTFAARVTVPSSAAPGGHDVSGQCVDGGQLARTTFTVTSAS